MNKENLDKNQIHVSKSHAIGPRVGLLTFHFVRNFGGVWQAFALSRTILDLGGEPLFVDYQPAHVEIGAPFQLGISRGSALANLTAAYQRCQRLRAYMFEDECQTHEFDLFRRDYLPTETPRYHSICQLRAQPPKADAFIVGSDQIWHRSKQFGFDPAYFLDFPTGEAKRYSYAASFGRSKATDGELDTLKARLNAFDELSVREESGRKYAVDLSGSDVHRHCDPTILQGDAITDLTRKCDLSRFGLPHRYISVYAVRSENAVANSMRELSKLLDAPTIRLHSSRLTPGTRHGEAFPGPIQWAAIIAQSQAVITNSFHGTIFSILLGRPFVCLSIGGKKTQMDDRVRNLLTQCGLEDRFCMDVDDAVKAIQAPIDWENVSDRLDEMRSEAIGYLTDLMSHLDRVGLCGSSLESSTENKHD